MTDRIEIRQRMQQQFRWRTDRSIDFSLANMDGWWDDPSIVGSLGPMLAELFIGQRATVILAPAASGLQLGPLVAAHLALRFVAVRKDPGSSMASDRWTLVTTPPDYRDRHQVLGWRASRVRAGDRVLVVDDVVETGAQLAAIQSGVQQSGATWVGAAVLIDMLSSNARRRELGVRAVFNSRDLP